MLVMDQKHLVSRLQHNVKRESYRLAADVIVHKPC